MSTTSSGREAEDSAAQHLRGLGYKIIEQNWRTRWCEIDVIAQKANRTYFVEVKYRKSDHWGSGMEYITPTKLKQMAFAAEFWVHNQNWTGDYQLAAVEVTGQDFKITNVLLDL